MYNQWAVSGKQPIGGGYHRAYYPAGRFRLQTGLLAQTTGELDDSEGTTSVASGRPQRRLAAILSADVVGYSRLMGIDETGTLARLQDVRSAIIDPTIAAHSGRTIKLIGDGALVEFASVVDAVACALEIQKLVQEHNSIGPEDRVDSVPDRHQRRRRDRRWRRHLRRRSECRGSDRSAG